MISRYKCDVTKNLIGTDTEMIGHPCQCQAHSMNREIERLRALMSRWSALDGGSWAVERHAREKAELLAETRAQLNPS
jgi:hypothetical protein